MAVPAFNDVSSQDEGWDADVDDNFITLGKGDTPMRAPLHAGDETDLQTVFPAASYDQCVIWVDHTTLAERILYTSDGTSWRIAWQSPTAVAALTDNSGGSSGGDTIAVVTDPADTPASADALRDDLVTNTIAELRNAVATLSAKVNELRTAARNHGMLP